MSTQKKFLLGFFGLLIVFLYVWNFYPQSGIVPYEYSDTMAHNRLASSLVTGVGDDTQIIQSYPLFFIITGWLGLLINNSYIAITIVAVLIGITTYITLLFFFFKKTSLNSEYLKICLAFGMTFVWPIVDGFDKTVATIAVDSFAVSSAHNLTSLAVRPFSLIATFLFLDIFNENNYVRKTIIFGFILLLSVLLKPSFYQYFSVCATAFAIIFFLKRRRVQDFKKCLCVAMAMIPATIWVIYGMTYKLNEIVIWPFKSLAVLYSGNVLECIYCLLRGNLFCVIIFFVLLINNKLSKDRLFLYSFVVVAFIEFILFVQINEINSFNMSWGYMNALYLLFVYSSKWLFELRFERGFNKTLKIICASLLLLHVLSGIYAYVKFADVYREKYLDIINQKQ